MAVGQVLLIELWVSPVGTIPKIHNTYLHLTEESWSPGNFKQSEALLDRGKRWTEKYFHIRPPKV